VAPEIFDQDTGVLYYSGEPNDNMSLRLN